MSNDIILYSTEDGQTKVELHLQDSTVWLSQLELAELFDTSKNNISLHVKNIFEDQELDKNSTVKDYLTVQKEGNRDVQRTITLYNLDMILAIGYRVRSVRGAQFRRYASTILKEYLISGFAINDDKVTQELDYFKKLQKRIRDIRTNERIFYKQVLDIFATSIDYDGSSKAAMEFFATVQNKMIYAVTGHTAPELIFNRIDADKENLGLTVQKGDYPTKTELKVSKNYLDEKELTDLNLIVSAYLDTAERQANQKIKMTMNDWKSELDRYLDFQRVDILQDKGKISRDAANKKVDDELKKYKALNKEVKQVDTDYFNALNKLNKK
ncbi:MULTISPECIES: RhuM family protein [Vagococcus]|uniref:Putative DNA-binding protein in cluster with Type I restriction-modification system n=1 Tax=Vagococcus fluvialis bH819 TaxID=1255619 RepID=A0A1X6WM36_9ENTE|nr:MULTISPECIES: RhuM family protein [Vagococcus]SLM85394.1 Putative DNA-binding protein in cluster with Type I restriction-modification system [Vagococcus fluvialis bH819]HCM89312.1 cell filamentation protein Fic [Vagococcus sp.]